jgi:hypothetical protein
MEHRPVRQHDFQSNGTPNKTIVPAFGLAHSLTFRTSPRRSTSEFRVSVSRRSVSSATWFAGITSFTAATARACSTAAIQSDLLPSGAVTCTMGILKRTVRIFGASGDRVEVGIIHDDAWNVSPVSDTNLCFQALWHRGRRKRRMKAQPLGPTQEVSRRRKCVALF